MNKKLYKNIEFSFGKGVGSEIYEAINKAKHSIFILTPYISLGYVDFLLRKNQAGVNVSLITTADAQNEKMHEIYKKLLVQHRVEDKKKIIFKNKLKKYCLLSGFISVLILATSIFLQYFHKISHVNLPFNTIIFISILICAFSSLFYKKFDRVEVFKYFYTTKFSFKVISTLYSQQSSQADSFLHAKIYVIDAKDVFIGSANFTYSGLRQNIESFVKISSTEAVREIMIDTDAYLNANCKFLTIKQLASRIYRENC